MSLLKRVLTPLYSTTQRNVGRCKYVWYNEGIQYPGFKYYPRHPDFKDPPYEPTKLLRVERIKPLKGTPYWERHILKEFNLDGIRNNCYTIVKNIPENNQRLWKVKHLIKITPITFPDGFPLKDDVTCLNEYGELRIVKNVKDFEGKLQLTESFQKDVKKLDGNTLRRDSRKKWLTAWE